MKGKNNENNYNYFVDLLRFAAAIFIMMFHFTGYTPGATPKFIGGYIFCEFYFILTGYFTFAHVKRNKVENNPAQYSMRYTLSKFKDIFFYTTICLVLDYGYKIIKARMNIRQALRFLFDLPFELFYTRSWGGNTNVQINTYWYLSALVIALPICMYFMIKHADLMDNIIIVFAPALIYSFFWKYNSILYTTDWYGFIPTGVMRAFAGIMLGCLVYRVAEWIGKNQLKVRGGGICLTIVELILCAGSFYLAYSRTDCDFYIIMIFVLMLSVIFSGKPVLQMTKNVLVTFLGKISLPLYLCHWSVKNVINTQLSYIGAKQRIIIMIIASGQCAIVLYALLCLYKSKKKSLQ